MAEQIGVDDRVRLPEQTSPDALARGTGTVWALEGEEVKVGWDGNNWALFRYPPGDLVKVTIVCSYAKQRWAAGEPFGIDGMIILCDTHKRPANGEVYDVDDPKTVTARCQGPWS